MMSRHSHVVERHSQMHYSGPVQLQASVKCRPKGIKWTYTSCEVYPCQVHDFYNGFEWHALDNRTMPAPWGGLVPA